MHAREQSRMIEPALSSARARWLNAATINAGGRWAVVAGVAAATGGMLLMAADARAPWALVGAAGVGLAGVFGALLLTRRAFARPGRPGAPDFALALDRALGLRDALPTLIESPGPFGAVLEARVAAALTPAALKRAAPPRHYAPLAVAMILCLLPLAGLAPDALPQAAPDAPQSADDDAHEETANDPEDGPEAPAGEGGESQGAPKGRKGDGQGGQPAPQPTAGDAPKDMPKPEAAPNLPPNNPGGAGDEKGPPPERPKPPEDKPVETKDNPITPDAGDGETRKEKRSRWLYDPNGSAQEGDTRAPKIENQGELAIPRQKLTAGERKRLEELYDKLYR